MIKFLTILLLSLLITSSYATVNTEQQYIYVTPPGIEGSPDKPVASGNKVNRRGLLTLPNDKGKGSENRNKDFNSK